MNRRLLILLLGLLAAVPFGCGSGKEKIRVFAADSLSASFGELESEFEKLHPDRDVLLDIRGSVQLTQLVPLRRVDVVAVADYRLIEKILHPEHSSWVAKFATTEIVLAHTTSSKYQAEINADNWFDILLRPDVAYGIADPALDPCGYYTRLAWKLAEKHYFTSKGKSRPLYDQLVAACPPKHIAIDALRLISESLSMNRVDYAFVYRVHARDLNLPHTLLPKEINLGQMALEGHYATVRALVPNYRGGTETMTGTTIAFGISIPKEPANLAGAQAFIRFVLSEQGQAILRRSDFQPLSPARVPKWCQGNVPPAFAGEFQLEGK